MFCLPSECSCKLSKYLSITAMTNGAYLETEVSKYLNIFFMYKLFWTYSESHFPLQFICLVLSNILLNPLVWINSHNFVNLRFCSYLACHLLNVISTVGFKMKMNEGQYINTLFICAYQILGSKFANTNL